MATTEDVHGDVWSFEREGDVQVIFPPIRQPYLVMSTTLRMGRTQVFLLSSASQERDDVSVCPPYPHPLCRSLTPRWEFTLLNPGSYGIWGRQRDGWCSKDLLV